MGLAVSSYYYKSKKDPLLQMKADYELRVMIESVQAEFPAYGYRRLREHFLKQGVTINHKRFKRVMKEFNLYSVLKKKFKAGGLSPAKYKAFPNLIKGNK